MKRISAVLMLLLIILQAVGCSQPTETPSPSPTATPKPERKYFSYESYVAQTSFEYSRNWEYQPDDSGVYQGTEEIFLLPDDTGTCQVQFVWLEKDRLGNDVWLEQVDADEVNIDDTEAGGYIGKRLSGLDGMMKIECFSGYRDWYGTGLVLAMRVYMQVEADKYTPELTNFNHLISSIETYKDEDLEQPETFRRRVYADVGLSFEAPEVVNEYPIYSDELNALRVEMDVDGEENLIIVEAGKITQSELDEFYKSLKQDSFTDGSFFGTYTRTQTGAEASCIYQGKVTKAVAWHSEISGELYYACVVSRMRPEYHNAYYDTVIKRVIGSIVQVAY